MLIYVVTVTENIHTPHGGQQKFKGEEGPKGGNFRGGGVASRVLFLVAPTKIDEQLPVILPLIGVSKQILLFSSMIFYLLSAECFFHGLRDSLCNTIAVGS